MARKYFQEYLKNLPNPSDRSRLPLTHGCRAISLRDILASGFVTLPAEPCEVLQDRYIFTFLGRASYRCDPSGPALRRPTGAPTYIVFNHDLLRRAAMVHPMDTGAFSVGVYEEFVDRALKALDFGFPTSPEYLDKLISHFFGDDESYLLNTPRRGLNIEHGNDEVEAYYEIVCSNAASGDDRNNSVEVVFDSDIPVSLDNVQCVVMPDALEDAENYGNKIKALGIDIVRYRFRRGYTADEYHNSISDALFDYYKGANIA